MTCTEGDWQKKKTSKTGPSEKQSRSRTLRDLGWLDQVSLSALGRGFDFHVEELSHERLKDPEYQEWMLNWLDGFLSAFLKGIREEKAARARKRKVGAPAR